MSEGFDAARIGVQLDRAEECGAIETDVAATLRAMVRFTADHPRSAPPRVEMEAALRARFPEFDRLVRAWAFDPMPKVRGLRILVYPHLGFHDAPMGLEVSLRAEYGFHLTAFHVTRIYGPGEIHGERGLRLSDLLTRTLDEMHRELVRGFRLAHLAGPSAPEAGRPSAPPDRRLRCLGCGVVRIDGDICEWCGAAGASPIVMNPPR